MSLRFTRRGLLTAGGAGLVVAGLDGVTRPVSAAVPAIPAGAAFDLVVYGATSAGVVAAVQMRRMGGTAVVLEPTTHVGGLSSSGLGATDTGRTTAIGGIAAEFYRRVYGKYHGTPVTPTSPTRFTFEPHVAGEVFADLIAEADVPVLLDTRLAAVVKVDNRIVGLVTDRGELVRGETFIDATYEGDLMAKARVAYAVGREDNSAYGETLNGVQHRDKHQFVYRVDPYVVPGEASSGLLPGVSGEPLAPQGSGDDRIQAYCYRMCLTKAPDRIPFPKPDGYDPYRYELLLRYVEAGWAGPFFTTHSMGGGKTDSNNNGAFSTDGIGLNYAYPEASHPVRQSILDEHRSYQQGLMWFLANDPRLPASIRDSTAAWGLPADEFTATGGWPPLLYVREARRMVSAYVMTEHDCRGTVRAPDPVGLASYTMDSHNCQRLVVDGAVRNEGDVQVGVPAPYGVSYRAIVPVESQCANLLVPVCLSATHIAYGSIRMEPVFMILGQSAATAAKLAVDRRCPVQQVPIAALQDRLRRDGQLLDWPPVTPGEVVVDNRSARGVVTEGEWVSSTATPGYYGSDYLHDGNVNKGRTWLRFNPDLPHDGAWQVYLQWTAYPNRASNVPVDVVHAGGVTTRTVDQRQSGGAWVPLGTWSFAAGTAAGVLIRTDGTDGYVIADAVRFAPA